MTNKLSNGCCAHMFEGCKNIKIIEKLNPDDGDIIKLDFRKGHGSEAYNKKAVEGMFKGCECKSTIKTSKFIKDGTPQKFFVYVQKK